NAHMGKLASLVLLEKTSMAGDCIVRQPLSEPIARALQGDYSVLISFSRTTAPQIRICVARKLRRRSPPPISNLICSVSDSCRLTGGSLSVSASALAKRSLISLGRRDGPKHPHHVSASNPLKPN